MSNTDLSHLNALQVGLSHERSRLAAAKSDGERQLRAVWVAQYERQISAEYAFLGIAPPSLDEILMSDDELLAALKA